MLVEIVCIEFNDEQIFTHYRFGVFIFMVLLYSVVLIYLHSVVSKLVFDFKN